MCQPHLFARQMDEESYNNSLQKEYIENLRRKCKQDLKKTTDRSQKMKLDEDLRQSYKYGNHDSLSFGKKKKKRVEVAVLCKKCEAYIENRKKALT